MTGQLPRGIRNNNPGNIRLGQPWEGLEPTQTDGAFCQFVDAAHGVRALAIILKTYQDVHHLRTVQDMIHRWAPPEDPGNDTGAYIDAVARRMGCAKDAPIDIHNRDTATAMVCAIITQENAPWVYPRRVVAAGLTLAGIV